MTSGSRNVIALLAEKLITLGGIAAVNIVILRALGPGTYGYLGAATAILAMCMPLTLFGNMTIVRLISVDPLRSRNLLTLATRYSLGGALVGALIIVGIAASTVMGTETSTLLLILSLALLARPLSAVDLWFQATRQNVIASRTRTVVSLTAAAARAAVATTTGSLEWMAVVIVLENAISGAALLLEHRIRNRSARQSRATIAPAERKEIFRTSTTYLLYALTVILFMRVDQPMLLVLSSSREVGVYAAAANISDAASFIPTSLLTAAMPLLSTLAANRSGRYLEATSRLFKFGAGAGYIVLAVGCGVAPFVIPLLYGAAYGDSVLLFQILLLGAPFLFVGHLRTAHVVNYNLQRETLWVGLIALSTNVLLNAALIPAFGASGAAAATSLAHAINGVFGGFLFRRTRPMALMQLRALAPLGALRTLVDVCRRRRL